MSPARAHFVLFLLAAVAGERPDAMNFVMLLADDLGWADVSPPPYPDKALWRTETPQLERMAREGLTLLGYRNASPLCSPSRMALLSGVFPKRFSLDGIIRTKNNGNLPRVPTLRAIRDIKAGLGVRGVGGARLGGGFRVAAIPLCEVVCMGRSLGTLYTSVAISIDNANFGCNLN